eukprot:symbB.v1.2.005910.t2/scaffold347.1/size224350/5
MADMMEWAMQMASLYGAPSGWKGDGATKGGKGYDYGGGGNSGGFAGAAGAGGAGGGYGGYGKGKGDSGGGKTSPATNSSCKVFVGGLPKVITEASVRQSFAHFGPIVEVKMMVGVMGESKGYCFITFANIESANAVLANYESNTVEGKQQSGGGPKAGDWTCPNCGDNVFAWRTQCNRCGYDSVSGVVAPPGTANGGGGKGAGGFSRPGDWICPSCGDLNFASRENCRSCGHHKPSQAQGVGGNSGVAGSEGPEGHGSRDEKVCQQQFDIFLVKSSNTLGIDVDLMDGRAMLVQAVRETGLVSEWNRTHPSLAVRQHDRIVKVNGIEGNTDLMAQKCREDSHLQLTVSRIGRASQ